jgi:hypothetical protein
MDVVVQDADEPVDVPEYDDSGAVLKINHADGSITVSLDGKPISEAEGKKADKGRWFANLVDDISESELSRIADDLLQGVADDLSSRKDWIEDRAAGIKLLGLKLEIPNISSSESAPVEGMSMVRHPLLLEGVLRFQANARAEMLPTDGPAKIRDDSNRGSEGLDELATAYEKDMNHYLTAVATEYYPDTDRMFLLLGFGGTTFKKVYNCPLRSRPVSETVDADDLIVNNTATDLGNASRITHRTRLKPSTVRRMQILGVYSDIELNDPSEPETDALTAAKDAQQGKTDISTNPKDRNRELYEVYCELDIEGFEHKYKGKVSGLEIPYIVTIDVSSRKILAITRNYNKPTDPDKLPEARKRFVKYTYIPGLGFYDIGLLHILGNTTNAVTAAWRELLDAGMFANFPGFLLADTGARQTNTTFRIPPGGAHLVKTGGARIQDAIMNLPYKEPSTALMQLTDNIAQTGARIGGTAEVMVGEGKQDAPVGSTLAMIEQASKLLNAIHKRMHTAQAEELAMLVECFRENPDCFWNRNDAPAAPWDQALFEKALDTYTLVPQADPNTASHLQRVMKVMALKQLQGQSPDLYDSKAVDSAALMALGFSNPEQFFKPADAAATPPPEVMKGMADIHIAQQNADANTMLKQAQAQALMRPDAAAAPPPDKGPELQLKAMSEQNKLKIADMALQRTKMQDDSRDADRQAEVEMERMRMGIEDMHLREAQDHEHSMQDKDHQMEVLKLAASIQAQKNKAGNGASK